MKLITVFLLVYSTLGNAQAVKFLSINEERNAASGFAITHYLIVVNISRNCAEINPKIKEKAGKSFKNWYNNNSLTYEASSAWIYYVINDMKTKHGSKKSSELQQALKKEFDSHTMNGLMTFFPNAKATLEKCNFFIELVNSHKMDILPNNEFDKPLKDIMLFHKNVINFEDSR